MQKLIRLFGLLVGLVLIGCASTRNKASQPIAEILVQRGYGGAEFEFYEIFSTEKEARALLHDKAVQKEVKTADFKNTQFVLLNMGQKTSGGYSFEVSAKETKEHIELTIHKVVPQPGQMVTDALTNPMAIVQINSAKKIVLLGIEPVKEE